MARFLGPDVLDALRAREAHGLTRMDAEAEVLGTDHAQLGGLIARSWSLPESLVRGISEHGRPRTPGDTLVHAVYLSDVLAQAVGTGSEDSSLGDGPDVEAFARAMGELGLTAADFDELRVLVAQRLREVESRFEDSSSVPVESSDHRV